MCDKEEYTPFLQLMKPAEEKINPYTKDLMAPTSINYPENEVTPPKVKSFILGNLPDYSETITSMEQLVQFRDNKED